MSKREREEKKFISLSGLIGQPKPQVYFDENKETLNEGDEINYTEGTNQMDTDTYKVVIDRKTGDKILKRIYGYETDDDDDDEEVFESMHHYDEKNVNECAKCNEIYEKYGDSDAQLEDRISDYYHTFVPIIEGPDAKRSRTEGGKRKTQKKSRKSKKSKKSKKNQKKSRKNKKTRKSKK